MSFVTPALLGGILLVGLPIVLHLVMRREPRKLVFPALRFVQSRRAVNQTRMKLRHWLLLALRCAIIGLLALALARPTLQGSGKLGEQNAPIAAALVFDDSLRMEYEHENRTRLDEAKSLADRLLDQLPSDAPIAIITRGTRYRGFAVDRGAAQLKVSRLNCSAVSRPLDDVLADAIDLLVEKDDHRGEIYVFTDRAESVWSDTTLAAVRGQLDRLPGATLYVIDVGVGEPHNVGLDQLRLSSETLVSKNPLTLEVDLLATGNAADDETSHVAELFLEEPSENGSDVALQKRGNQVIAAGAEQPSTATFLLTGLDVGTHQGQVRIATDDPLPVDNTRYFTLEVRPPRKLLLVAAAPQGALFMREAIAPSGSAGANQSKFACTTAVADELTGMSLDEFDAVLLLDIGPLPTVAWDSLSEFVRNGGGLGVLLGRNASRGALEVPAAAQLLAGTLRWKSRDETYLRPVTFDHPVLAPFADYAESVPWSLFPVLKYWELESLAEGARVVASYANGKPAIVERSVDGGRVLTMTTPLSDPAHRDPWNLLPTGPDPWPFLALAGSMSDYLSGASDDRLNYLAGETVVVREDVPLERGNFVLRLPSGEAVRQSLAPGRDEVVVTTTSELGNYRLESGGAQGQLDRGFSVNVVPEISRLERVPFDTIEDALGKERVKLARTADEIDVQVGLGRVGRELFPWFILAVVVVLCAEQLLANRFYRSESVST
jgi:hypothetical protein